MLSLLVALTVLHAAFSYEPTDPNYRIVQGEDANEGDFPFVVSMHLTKLSIKRAGVILTKSWVLTTASTCQYASEEKDVVNAGSVYLDHGGRNHTIDKIISHIRFSGGGRWFDVCIVRMSEPFEFGEQVQQATLKGRDSPVELDDNYTFVGWGKTGRNNFRSNRLQRLDFLTRITQDECSAETYYSLYPGFICVRPKTREQGLCDGDEGGPLIRNGTVLGLGSAFQRPCRNQIPSIITSVPYFREWILKNLGPDAGDVKFSS